MKTLLIPIDFSENSIDAARYALGCVPQLHIRKVLLYHSHDSGNVPQDSRLQELESLAGQLDQNDNTEIICEVNNDTLMDGVVALVRRYQVSLIVMGITGRNKVGQKLIGSNALKILQNAEVPVLVVPADSRFVKIENVALALPVISDLSTHVPKDKINAFVAMLGANLMLVNVGRKNDKTPKPVLYAALKDMVEMFEELNPSYHFLTSRDTANSVTDFVRDNNTQLLISISGKYGFLQGMFKSSVTQKLAYNSDVPLLIYRSGQ